MYTRECNIGNITPKQATILNDRLINDIWKAIEETELQLFPNGIDECERIEVSFFTQIDGKESMVVAIDKGNIELESNDTWHFDELPFWEAAQLLYHLLATVEYKED